MEPSPKRYYRAKEFADLAGVTVRTLHFYDRLGLLTPSDRTEAGYRLYGEEQLERLEQILALRFVRFRLDHIKKLLSGPPQPLIVALRMQRHIVAQEQARLSVALEAIDKAHDILECNDRDERRWEAIHDVIEAFRMKDDYSWTSQYYSEEDQQKLARTRAELGEAGMQKAQQDWADLIADVETAAKQGVAAESEQAQDLLRRWDDLISQFTRNDPGVSAGLNKLYSDRPNWPSHFQRPWSDDAQAFLEKIRAANT